MQTHTQNRFLLEKHLMFTFFSQLSFMVSFKGACTVVVLLFVLKFIAVALNINKNNSLSSWQLELSSWEQVLLLWIL